MCKKLIPFILVLAMLLSIVPAVTAAEQQAPQFTTRSLSLNKSIAINFKVPYDDVKDNFFKVDFIKDGESVQEIGSLPAEDSRGMAVFTFSELSPLDLGKEITARLYYTAENYTEVNTSVLDYCNAVLRNPENTTELKTLVVDLLNYGATFQTYKDVTTELVNESLTDEQKAMGTQTEPELNSCLAIGEEMTDPSVTWEEASVILEDSVTMSFKVRANEVAGIRMKVTCNGSSWIITEFESLDESGVYKLYFDRLNPAQMRDKIEAVICDAAGNPISNTLTFSIESYAAYQAESATDADLVALVKAMMRYGDSAAVWSNDTSSDITRADIETALAEVAWDFYMKDEWIQYDSVDLNTRTDGNNNPISRWYGGHTRLDNYLNTLEDANSDDTMYSVCSYLPWAVYYETLDYPLLGNSLNASTLNLWLYAETPDDMCVIRCHSWPEGTYQSSSRENGYVTHDKCVSYEEMREFLTNWEENLRPGDIFYAISGHTALYVGNGWIIESQGKKYNMVTGVDTLEIGGSIKAWTVEDYFLNEESGSNYLLSRLLEDDQKRVCVLRPLDLLTVDDGDSNPGNDILDEEYELDIGTLNLQFSSDPNNILKTSGYTIQASAYSRLAYPAMNIDRTVNTTTYGTAVTGGTLTYSIAISNESNNPDYVAYRSYGKGSTYLGTNYENLCITETVPENTTLIDAAGANIVGNSLTWVVDVPVGETVIVSYTVQVTGAIGEYIINDGGMVANIPSNSLTNKIGGAKLSNDALANMNEFYESGTDVWNSNDGYKISAGVTQGTRFAERIYNETVGIDLQLPEIQELVNILFAQTMVEEEHGMYLQNSNGSNSKYMYTLNDTTADSANQIYRDMLVEGYYGGVWVYSNSYAGEPRIDELRTDYLEAGDILLYLTLENSVSNGQSSENRDVSQWQILVYLGNGRFAALTSSGKLKALENSQAVLPAFTYDIFFALRPSQVYANVNTDVAAFSGPGAELTEDDLQQKYTPQISDIMLNEQLSANLATLTPNDGWTTIHFNFVGEVYKKLGIDAPVADYWGNSYATHLKNLFADNIDSDSDACAIYQHEYTLLQEPAENSEKMFESLIYYDGPTMVIKNPVTTLEDLHPGDVIMAGFRRERHYVYLVYQGQGSFLYAMSSLTGGAENLYAYGEPIYGQYSFETDEEFLDYLYGPIDATRSELSFESYLVLRPSRVYEDINQLHILRNIAESVLTDEEKNALACLTVADWQNSSDSPKNNLKGAGNWMYKAAGIDTSNYLDITVDAMRKIIFQSVLNETYNKKYYTPATATEDTLKYHVMLVTDSWGGEYFAPDDQHPASTALQIGDIFCGIYPDGKATVYWVGLYQGNGNFLVQQSHSTNGLDCFVRSCTDVNAIDWRLYYVLRPQNLASYCRNISTGALTVAEKQKLANLSPEAWPGGFANLKKSSQWFYNAAGVDVSTFITDNIAAVKSDLFTGSNTNLVVKESNTSAYAAMLIDGYYGSRSGFKHGQFSAADFEIGDIFCAFGDCIKCNKSYYMTAVYQGNGTFLSIVNCGTGQDCVLSCDHDMSTVFAEDFFAQNSVAAWKYYFVLRPDQINNAS